MKNKIISSVKNLVESTGDVTLKMLIEKDCQDLTMVEYLISKLAGFSLRKNIITEDEKIVFTSPSGAILMSIEKLQSNEVEINGDMLDQLKALVLAIRIHEVDSYDLVYLPPEVRQMKISEILGTAGISSEQFNRAISIWNSIND